MGAILADVAILISIALQYGVPVGALVKSVGCVPDPATGTAAIADPPATIPASPVGATLDWLEKITGGGS